MADAKQDTKATTVEQDAAKKVEDHKADVAKEQETVKGLAQEVKGKSNYDQQEIYGRAYEEHEGEDSFRKAARLEREQQRALNEGDPIHDPVAKQKAMDKSGVAPGAVADAQKIKDIGAAELAKKNDATGVNDDVNPSNVK